MIIVIWRQEDRDGTLKVFDKTFSTQQEVDKHISDIEKDAEFLNKPLKILKVQELNGQKIKPNKAHMGRKQKGKGSGWPKESRRHAMSTKGVQTSKRR